MKIGEKIENWDKMDKIENQDKMDKIKNSDKLENWNKIENWKSGEKIENRGKNLRVDKWRRKKNRFVKIIKTLRSVSLRLLAPLAFLSEFQTLLKLCTLMCVHCRYVERLQE